MQSDQAAKTAILMPNVAVLEIFLEEEDAEFYENSPDFRVALNSRIESDYRADVVYILAPDSRRIGKLFDCREIPF